MKDAVILTELEDAYISNQKSLGRSPATWGRHQSTHKLFHRFLRDAQIPEDSLALSTPVMRKFSQWMQDTPLEKSYRGTTQRSLSGIRSMLKDMRAFTKWLFEEDQLELIPKIPLPKAPDMLFPILEESQLEQIWQCKYLSGRSSIATRNRALIGLMLDTGLRRGEVASLTLSKLELENCLVTVVGKGQKQRRVPFSSSVGHLIEAWLAVRGAEEGSVFWLQAAGIRQVFRSIRDEVGIERFHPHMLRHQAATQLVRNNADVESVRRILGHSDIATTIKYLSMSDDDLRAKHAAASPFDSLLQQVATPDPVRKRRLSLKD